MKRIRNEVNVAFGSALALITLAFSGARPAMAAVGPAAAPEAIEAISNGRHMVGVTGTAGVLVNGVSEYYGAGLFYTFRLIPYVGIGVTFHALRHATIIHPHLELIVPIRVVEIAAGFGYGPSYIYNDHNDGIAAGWGTHLEAKLRVAGMLASNFDVGMEIAASIAGYHKDSYGVYSTSVPAVPIRLVGRFRF